MMMMMMMMMMSERRHVRDVLRTFFFDLLSGRDTHKKKKRAVSGFRGDAFGGRLLFSSCVLGERKRERNENGELDR